MRTYTEEQVLAMMELADAYDKLCAIAQQAHRAEIASLAARGYLADADKETRDRIRNIADAALKITMEADSLAASINAIRREVA